MSAKFVTLTIFGTIALTSPTLFSHGAHRVQSGPSSTVLTCDVSTDGPPGGCPSGDCVTACTVVSSTGSTVADIHLLLQSGEATPAQVILTQDDGTAVYASELPLTIAQLVLRNEWVSVEDHDTGGPAATNATKYTIELVF